MRRHLRKLLNRLQPDRPAILMYHRIAEPPVDPWGLSVSPANFRSQLRALRAHRRPLPMDGFVELLKAGKLPPRAVAITFDDGYRDNLNAAKPILEQEGVAATVFVTTGAIGAQRLFWWDELAQMTLLAEAPFDTAVDLGGTAFRLVAGPMQPGEPRRDWRAWTPAATAREKLYAELWQALQRLDPPAREEAMAALRERLGDSAAPPADLPMTAAELGTLPSGLIAVGGHALTHQPLTSMTPDRQDAEIVGSRETCVRITGGEVTGFAYPHGDADAQVRARVAAAGYRWACSTHSATVPRRGYDLYDLPRLMASDQPGPALIRTLRAAA